MQLPDTTIATQSLLKMGFRNASQVDVLVDITPVVKRIDRLLVQRQKLAFNIVQGGRASPISQIDAVE